MLDFSCQFDRLVLDRKIDPKETRERVNIMFCLEYQEGFRACSDCNVNLVDELAFGSEKEPKDQVVAREEHVIRRLQKCY